MIKSVQTAWVRRLVSEDGVMAFGDGFFVVVSQARQQCCRGVGVSGVLIVEGGDG